MCFCLSEFIVKYVLFFFNLVFNLAGLALVIIGSIFLSQLGDVFDLFPVNLEIIPILIIVAGCLIFVISFSGCCGAIRENSCLLITYSVFMIILASAKTWLAVVILNQVDKLSDTVSGWVNSAFQNGGQVFNGPYRALELLFKCCGTTGVQSYQNLPFIPATCCANPDDVTFCDNAQTYYGGCTNVFTDYLSNFGSATGNVLIGIICVELLAMIFALFLNHRIVVNRRGKVY